MFVFSRGFDERGQESTGLPPRSEPMFPAIRALVAEEGRNITLDGTGALVAEWHLLVCGQAKPTLAEP